MPCRIRDAAIRIDGTRKPQAEKEIVHRAVNLHAFQTEKIVALMNRAFGDTKCRFVAGAAHYAFGVCLTRAERVCEKSRVLARDARERIGGFPSFPAHFF